MKTFLCLFALLAGVARAQETNVAATVTTNREPTNITSDRLQVDYAHNTGTFEGNVLVIDTRITLRADKMVVLFAGGATPGNSTNANGSIQRVLADGGVVITQGERKATSEHAEYTAGDGKVVLTGRPRVEQPGGTVTGEKITFWRGEHRMDVESLPAEERTRVTIYPDPPKEEKKDEPKPEPPTGSAQ